MTGAQRQLYLGMLHLFALMGTGGAAWTGVRGSTTGLAAPTYEALASCTIRFLENNRVAERSSLPAIPVYTAPWWGLAVIGVDVAVGDIYTNGVIAFTVTGLPDTSQGFQVIPASPLPLIEVPSVTTGQAGYRSPLWILGISA